YKDYEGEILLCGKPISQTPQKIISKKFSVVFQDYAHYYLTLKENILIGNLQANEDTIQQAISLFSLDKVLTSLNELAVLNKGDNFNADLSGGQWQNLALARSYIGNGEILIFDEPTASLSPMQETKIYTFLKDITKNKTAIFISHRLGIAPLVDEILLLKDGYILERGSHEELIANKSSVYYSMYNMQKELYV
ncbi:ATP-binding cassette domain-containing protein, partial [Treponema pedis]